ncbi:MAG: hypothetical protein ACOX8V_04100 [Thermoleophilia bacterium]|jgi:hypothetical protein
MGKRKKTLIVSVLAVALTFAVAVPAFAATGTTPAAPATPKGAATCMMGQGGMRGFGSGSQMLTAIADLLNMEPADLAAARQGGKSLAEIAESKGVDRDTLINGMLEVRKAVLADAVAKGTITQGKADIMVKNMSVRIAERVDDTKVGPPADRGGNGRGGQGACGVCTGAGQGAGQGAAR